MLPPGRRRRLDDIVAGHAERDTDCMKRSFDNGEFQKAITAPAVLPAATERETGR